MASIDGPQFPGIQDGLVFCFDPKNRDCWEGGVNVKNIVLPSLTGTVDNTTASSTEFTGAITTEGYFNFDGTDDHVEYTNDAIYQITGDITISGWVYLDAYDGNNDHLISKELSYMIKANQNSTSVPRFQIRIGTNWHTLEGGSQLSLSTWNNMIGIRDGDTMRMYINGADIGSTTSVSGTTVSNTNPLNIASYDGGSSYSINGRLGPCMVYNRVLSAAEVLTNYNRLKDRFGL